MAPIDPLRRLFRIPVEGEPQLLPAAKIRNARELNPMERMGHLLIRVVPSSPFATAGVSLLAAGKPGWAGLAGGGIGAIQVFISLRSRLLRTTLGTPLVGDQRLRELTDQSAMVRSLLPDAGPSTRAKALADVAAAEAQRLNYAKGLLEQQIKAHEKGLKYGIKPRSAPGEGVDKTYVPPSHAGLLELQGYLEGYLKFVDDTLAITNGEDGVRSTALDEARKGLGTVRGQLDEQLGRTQKKLAASSLEPASGGAE